MTKQLTRRQMLKAVGATVLLAGCAGPTPVPTKAPAAAAPTATAAPAAKAPVGTVAPAAGKCQMDWNPTFPPVPKKYDPPIKISSIFNDKAPPFQGKDSWTNNPMYNRVKDNLGIEYTIHWQASGDIRTQKWNADIAAGTLPDVFNTSTLEIEKLIQANLVEEIRGIWEATASPLTRQKKDYPNNRMWECVRRGDKLYGIAYTNGAAHNIAHLGFIRQDWLDKLGLKAPTTLDELTAVLKAFRDKKLSKFGLAACKRLANAWQMGLDVIFGAYGSMPRQWLKGADGKLEYGSIQPAAKEALTQIRAWYKEGFIDPDFYTYNEADPHKNLGSGKDGVYFAPWFTGSYFQQAAEAENPGMRWAMMPLPAGPTGLRHRKDSGDYGLGVCFRKGAGRDKIEAVIHEQNWVAERHVNWEKYQQYGEWRNSTAFVQGYEWEFDDKCELKKGPIDNLWELMGYVGANFASGAYPSWQTDIFRDLLKWQEKDPKALNKAQRYLLANPTVIREGVYYLEGAKPEMEIANEYLGVPTANMIKLLPDLYKIEDEVYIGIVTGSKPLEAFEQFVKDWKAIGGDSVTADVNAWWAARTQ